jgi:hypothetical protein
MGWCKHRPYSCTLVKVFFITFLDGTKMKGSTVKFMED